MRNNGRPTKWQELKQVAKRLQQETKKSTVKIFTQKSVHLVAKREQLADFSLTVTLLEKLVQKVAVLAVVLKRLTSTCFSQLKELIFMMSSLFFIP
jgi:hypothetical protein